jgi:hypothetical protein
MQRLRGREARTRSIGTKLTPAEEKEILQAAEAQGKAPSEWAREQLLRKAAIETSGQMEMHIFTELVGIQMLLMGTLEPLLRGSNLPAEQVDQLFRQVQTTKAAKAQELLSRRSQKQEK